MPIVQFHLVADQYPEEAVAALLEAASFFYVQALYPTVSPPPLERVRAFATSVPAHRWATGGRLVSDGAAPAPWFTCIALEGRPTEQLQALAAGFTDLVERHLGCDRSLIRGTVMPVAPALWSIGGVPASEARASEASLRAG
ncbi:tautomerase family protein [Sphingobium sp. CFD-2]|uniref:tautomerase family protein n=1 Tax=Sphingobium sp. CFD-2 TaxID=2878542 RepID=UPI00214C7FAD|nr:tautomerase family protein [Sphingobium sp. CFD-2]